MGGPNVSNELPSLGSSLALSFLSLGVVCLLAFVVLRWLARRTGMQTAGPIRVLARCPLEPRRTLLVVEIAGRGFVLASSEGGVTMLAELRPEELAAAQPAHPPLVAPGARFAQVLARALASTRISEKRPQSDQAGEGP